MLFLMNSVKRIIIAVLIVALAASPVLAADEIPAAAELDIVKSEAEQGTQSEGVTETLNENRQDETQEQSNSGQADAKEIAEPAKSSAAAENGSGDSYDADREDPEFFKYYTVDENGNIVRKDSNTRMYRAGSSSFGGYAHPAKYSSYTKYHCIDVSEFQGNINWAAVRKAGITHAIIRIGYRGYGAAGNMRTDEYFKKNITRAYNAGIKVGVYIYSQALTQTEARAEADFIMKYISPYRSKITLPVVFDYEFSPVPTGRFVSGKISKAKMTANCTAFCERVRAAGYEPMVYANYSMLTNHLDYKTLHSKYKIWLAHYTSNKKATDYPGSFYMWQYASDGYVSGINGRVDVNYIYDNSVRKTVNEEGKEIFVKADGTVLKSRWVYYRGNYYYSSSTGPILKGFYTVDGRRRYFNSSGIAASKAWLTTSSGNRYYRISKGALATGYNKIGYYYYGFSSSGVMYKGIVAMSGKRYKFASDGKSVLYTVKTKTGLNYRSGPSTGYRIKGSYRKDTSLNIVRYYNGWGRMTNGYWIKLTYTYKTAWYPQLISPYKAKTTTYVNYRTGPSTSYRRVGSYQAGKIITITQIRNGWGRMANGYWIKLTYVRKI